jgi:hypothetical protein
VPLPSIADFHARFDRGEPAFASVDDAVVTRWIAYAGAWCDASVWGDWYAEGVLLRAAHELSCETDQSARGGAVRVARELESQSVDGVSMSRGQGIAREAGDQLSRTAYGQRFVQLRRLVARFVAVL